MVFHRKLMFIVSSQGEANLVWHPFTQTRVSNTLPYKYNRPFTMIHRDRTNFS